MTPISSAAPSRLLIIRLSSFGDIVQAVGVPRAFKDQFPNARVDWLVREDFKGLLDGQPAIDRVISFSRRSGVIGLLRLAWALSHADYTHVYDAHANLRSNLIGLYFRLFSRVAFLRRSKERMRRWLFFRLRLAVLPKPFRGADSFHRPLTPWGLEPRTPSGALFSASEPLPTDVVRDLDHLRSPLIALAPSAAWEMKRWPVAHWQSLIRAWPEASFVLLGGPEDQFIETIQAVAPERTVNLAGRLTLRQSAALFARADLVIANDTGLLHVADQMERPLIALIGPTAFGYPSHATSETMEIELNCKPCSKDGRGRCVNELYKRCLVDLKPEAVLARARQMLT